MSRQWTEAGFGSAWPGRWSELDSAFLLMEADLAELGKPVAQAVIDLVAKRFPFDGGYRFSGEETQPDAL